VPYGVYDITNNVGSRQNKQLQRSEEKLPELFIEEP